MSVAAASQPVGKLRADDPFAGLIEDAYRAFKGPVPETTGVCECCTDPAIRRRFFDMPAADLPMLYLNDWYQGAVSVPLDREMWRHILPRVLESLASGVEPSAIATEVTFRAPTGARDLWTKDQWDVLDQFQRRLLSDRRMWEIWELDELLCMFTLGGWKFSDLWAQVMGWSDLMLVDRLHNDWAGWSIRPSSFWPKDVLPEVLEAYRAPELVDRMLEIGVDDPDDEVSAKALHVADIVNQTC
jgi:hypothetical protein